MNSTNGGIWMQGAGIFHLIFGVPSVLFRPVAAVRFRASSRSYTTDPNVPD